MARGDNLEEIMSMLREGHSKEDVLSAVVEGRLGHEQPEESIRERNRKKEASEKQTFQCVMCKEYLEIHATSEHMKSHADRIIEEMKGDIRREYDVLWNKIKT